MMTAGSTWRVWLLRVAALFLALPGAWFAVAVVRADLALGENAGLEELGRSSLQFAFDRHHTGVIEAPLSVETYSPKSVYYPPAAASGKWPTPIYVNGRQTRIGPLEDRQVLIFGARREVVAWDVVNDEVIWRVSDLPGDLNAAPYLDAETARLYFVTTGWIRVEEPVTEQGIFRIRHWVHSVSVGQPDLHTVEIDTAALLEHEYSEFTNDPSSFVHCKGAVGVNMLVDRPYVFFGCSMFGDPSIGLFYGHMKGSRGILIQVHLDGEYHVSDSLGGFTPSVPTANPHTGFDGGIYNVGSGPVVLDDGSVLVATGNGPFLPEEHNYGCSVVRLNGSTFSPEAKRAGGYEYYSHGDGTFNECHGANLDMGSSSPAVLEHEGRYYAAITGKDGYLKVFDPFDLPGQERARKHEFHLGAQAHG